jgi:hypothetical protein
MFNQSGLSLKARSFDLWTISQNLDPLLHYKKNELVIRNNERNLINRRNNLNKLH